MESSGGRGLFWNALAGIGVGMSCTVATALFATGGGCTDRRLAVALLIWSPLLSALPPVLTSSRRLGHGSAAALAGVLAILMGAVNAIAVWTTTQFFSEYRSFDELGAVLVFALPFGGVPGAGYALPLGLATYFARKKVAAPRGAIGAGRALLLTIAIVGTATSALLVSAEHIQYSLWPAILTFDAGLALLCVTVAARDVRWALRLRRMARDASGALEIADADPETMPAGLTHVAGGSRGARPTLVYRLDDQDALPYRNARTRVPILSLDAPPVAVSGVLLRGAALLLVCAALLVWSATQTPHLAPDSLALCGP